MSGHGWKGFPKINKLNELPIIPKRKPDKIIYNKTYKF